jgi:membrane protease YdiL (CAAX protease family)
MVARLYRRWFHDPWVRINEEAAAERVPGLDRRVPAILIVVALIMVFQEYFGDRPSFDQYFGRYADRWHTWYQLGSFGWWSGSKVVGYLVVPLVAARLMRMPLADLGLSTKGFAKHAWIYGVLYLAILPVVVGASFTPAFQATYPFYKLAARSWTDFVAWELMYASTFLALEVFFRGFLLFPLKRALGAYAIFVMIVPYCMIHFHKPIAEVVGAIFAGIVLGTLAMVTRSVWCGVLIHISVAWTMDLCAMLQVYGVPGSGRVYNP